MTNSRKLLKWSWTCQYTVAAFVNEQWLHGQIFVLVWRKQWWIVTPTDADFIVSLVHCFIIGYDAAKQPPNEHEPQCKLNTRFKWFHPIDASYSLLFKEHSDKRNKHIYLYNFMLQINVVRVYMALAPIRAYAANRRVIWNWVSCLTEVLAGLCM